LAGALEVLAFRLDQLGHAVEASAARDEAASIRFQLNAG
jgi:hypothetical protein